MRSNKALKQGRNPQRSLRENLLKRGEGVRDPLDSEVPRQSRYTDRLPGASDSCTGGLRFDYDIVYHISYASVSALVLSLPSEVERV